MRLDYKTLKTRQRAERDNYPINLGLRVHRALSWLDRAEQCEGDDDARNNAGGGERRHDQGRRVADTPG